MLCIYTVGTAHTATLCTVSDDELTGAVCENYLLNSVKLFFSFIVFVPKLSQIFL